jgi:hypothetical protein
MPPYVRAVSSVGRQSLADKPPRGGGSPPDIQLAKAGLKQSGHICEGGKDLPPYALAVSSVGRQSFADKPPRGGGSPLDIQMTKAGLKQSGHIWCV